MCSCRAQEQWSGLADGLLVGPGATSGYMHQGQQSCVLVCCALCAVLSLLPHRLSSAGSCPRFGPAGIKRKSNRRSAVAGAVRLRETAGAWGRVEASLAETAGWKRLQLNLFAALQLV